MLYLRGEHSQQNRLSCKMKPLVDDKRDADHKQASLYSVLDIVYEIHPVKSQKL